MSSEDLHKKTDGNEGVHQLMVKNTFLEFSPKPKGFKESRRASAPMAFTPVVNDRRGSHGKISTDGESLDTEACSSVLTSAETESVGAWAEEYTWSSSDDTVPVLKPAPTNPPSGLATDVTGTAELRGLLLTSTRPADFESLRINTEIASTSDAGYYYPPYAAHECTPNVDHYGQWQMGVGHHAPVGHHSPMATYPPAPDMRQSPGGYGAMPEWPGYNEPVSPTRHREPLSPVSPSRQDNRSQPGSPKRKPWAGANLKPAPTENFVNEDQYTTVMLRNLPNDYTRDMLMELLDGQGFSGRFDFIYVPFDFKKHAGLGYAFMNMVTHEDATHAMRALTGFHDWKLKSNKVLQIAWSTPLQGLWANVERYKNSPVMHPDVPNEFKPLLLVNGVSVDFPPPTKTLQAPVLNQ